MSQIVCQTRLMENYCLSQIQNQVSNLCFVWEWKKRRLLRNWADKIDWEDRGLGARESARSPAGVLQLPGEPGLLLQHNLSQPNSNVSSLLQLC